MNYAGPGIVMGNDGIYISWNIFSDYAKNAGLISKQAVIHALDTLLGENKTLVTSLSAQGITTLMNQEDEKRYVCRT